MPLAPVVTAAAPVVDVNAAAGAGLKMYRALPGADAVRSKLRAVLSRECTLDRQMATAAVLLPDAATAAAAFMPGIAPQYVVFV